MSLLEEGAAHPNAPLEKTKEAFPFLLLPHGREVAEGKKFPGALREGEREGERRRNEEERRERSQARLEKERKRGPERFSPREFYPEPLRAALPPSKGVTAALLDSRGI